MPLETLGLTYRNLDANCAKVRLGVVAWPDRQRLMCGEHGVALSPHGRTFVIGPKIGLNQYLLIAFDALKQDFKPNDIVPFPEHAAEAIAAYVKWRILLEVDRDAQGAAAQYEIYRMRRRDLYLEAREQSDPNGIDPNYIISVPIRPSPEPAPSQPWDGLTDSWDNYVAAWDSYT